MRIEKVTVEVYDDEEMAVTFHRGNVKRQYVIFHTVGKTISWRPHKRVYRPKSSKERLYRTVERMCKNDTFYLSGIELYSWTIKRRLFDPGR